MLSNLKLRGTTRRRISLLKYWLPKKFKKNKSKKHTNKSKKHTNKSKKHTNKSKKHTNKSLSKRLRKNNYSRKNGKRKIKQSRKSR